MSLRMPDSAEPLTGYGCSLLSFLDLLLCDMGLWAKPATESSMGDQVEANIGNYYLS